MQLTQFLFTYKHGIKDEADQAQIMSPVPQLDGEASGVTQLIPATTGGAWAIYAQAWILWW